ncbi:MAG: glycerophosphodiester phosphodiesterase [Hyphomicrobium sp. 32-62-53]|nr:MAG: glycerophosphodiester phosphodiesterase [Hyphomicrobium sp. 12-62-95]OYY01382.1 MAG: glycerophosphodiester phosphodiesterase [Hyphomicrobium sp. 32-62-53]
MLDRGAFLRPIAHRGLYNFGAGIVENTAAAFEAAIEKGFGIECDLRPARGGLPVVFHDETTERLMGTEGRIHDLRLEDLHALRTSVGGHGMLTFEEFLALVDGRVPLLVEIKSEWDPPDIPFLAEIARRALDYRGDIALMSFDPDVMTVMRELATEIPRGVVSGGYKDEHGETWWRDRISDERADRLANLLESGPVAPSFYAYHVKSLPTPVTRYAREVAGMPVFAWTVRTHEDRARSHYYADAPIFEE